MPVFPPLLYYYLYKTIAITHHFLLTMFTLMLSFIFPNITNGQTNNNRFFHQIKSVAISIIPMWLFTLPSRWYMFKYQFCYVGKHHRPVMSSRCLFKCSFILSVTNFNILNSLKYYKLIRAEKSVRNGFCHIIWYYTVLFWVFFFCKGQTANILK